MEKLNVHDQRGNKQQTKAKKKPIKVTYFSNPMKVTANSEAEFRAVVQELTGRDSGTADNLSKFQPSQGGAASTECIPKVDDSAVVVGEPSTAPRDVGANRHFDVHRDLCSESFDVFDQGFNLQVVDNFAQFMPSILCDRHEGDGAINIGV